MMKSLFLQAPSFDGFDGGAGARYQMSREVRSFWYPTWLAQPAALVEGSKLIDAPPHVIDGTENVTVQRELHAIDISLIALAAGLESRHGEIEPFFACFCDGRKLFYSNRNFGRIAAFFSRCLSENIAAQFHFFRR